MICRCGHEAIPYDSEKGQIGDCFYSVSWELVDVAEYAARKADGRTVYLSICPQCYVKYTGKEYLTVGEMLHHLDKQRREQGSITYFYMAVVAILVLVVGGVYQYIGSF